MKIVKYVTASLIILAGIGNIAKGEMLAGIFTVLLGSLIFPIISEMIIQNTNFWQIKGIRYTTYAILLFLIGINIKPKEKLIEPNYKEAKVVKSIKVDKPQTKLSAKDKDKSEFWKKFDPIVKERIYKMIEDKDCVGLQEEFNISADNMDKKQKAGGSGSRNLDLMDFLNDEMKKLDCYNK